MAAVMTEKSAELLALPPAVVTAILPLVAPLGTTAVMEVVLITVKVVAAIPLNFTAVAPEKFMPVMVTTVPVWPLVGVKEVIVGKETTVKLVALLAVPPGVVTLILPVVAPTGTMAFNAVAEILVIVVDATPLNFTALAPVKLVPIRVTVDPTRPDWVKAVIDGKEMTVKLVALVAVPPGVVTEILPVVAPTGTMAFNEVAEIFVMVVDARPLNFTARAPVRLVPIMVTVDPTRPDFVKAVIVGKLTTVKSVLLLAVKIGVVTLILPVVAPTGTMAFSEVAEILVIEVDATPLNLTALVPIRLVPITVTVDPIRPDWVKVVIVGKGITMLFSTIVPAAREKLITGEAA